MPCGAGAAFKAAPETASPGRMAASRAAIPRREVKDENMLFLLFELFANLRKSWQSKTENVAAGGDSHVLFRIHPVGHGRSGNVLTRVEMPQRLAGLRVHRFESLRVIAEEDQAARGRHGASGGAALACLSVVPRGFIVVQREGQQDFLVVVPFAAMRACRIIRLARFEFLRLQKENVTGVQGHEIEPGIPRIVGRRVPVGSSDKTGAHARAFRGRLKSSANRAAFIVNCAGPIEFFDEWSGREKRAIGAIEHIQKAVAVGLYNEFSRLTAESAVHKDGSFDGVVVEQVVRRELEIPFELAGVRIEGKQAIGVEVVARPRTSIEVGRRITGAPEDGVQFRVKRAGHPGGATAEFVAFTRPTGGAEFSRAWNRPEAPYFRTALGIVGRHKAAYAIVAARGSHDDLVLNH